MRVYTGYRLPCRSIIQDSQFDEKNENNYGKDVYVYIVMINILNLYTPEKNHIILIKSRSKLEIKFIIIVFM